MPSAGRYYCILPLQKPRVYCYCECPCHCVSCKEISSTWKNPLTRDEGFGRLDSPMLGRWRKTSRSRRRATKNACSQSFPLKGYCFPIASRLQSHVIFTVTARAECLPAAISQGIEVYTVYHTQKQIFKQNRSALFRSRQLICTREWIRTTI